MSFIYHPGVCYGSFGRFPPPTRPRSLNSTSRLGLTLPSLPLILLPILLRLFARCPSRRQTRAERTRTHELHHATKTASLHHESGLVAAAIRDLTKGANLPSVGLWALGQSYNGSLIGIQLPWVHRRVWSIASLEPLSRGSLCLKNRLEHFQCNGGDLSRVSCQSVEQFHHKCRVQPASLLLFADSSSVQEEVARYGEP